MEIFFILPILTFVLILFLSLIVFLKNPKGNLNLTFLFLNLSALWWVVTNFIIDYSKNLTIAFRLSQITIIGPAFLAPICLYFSLIFPTQRKKISSYKILLIFLPAFLFLALSPTKFNVEKVWMEEWGINFKPGILYYFLLFYLITYFSLIFYYLFKSYKETKGIEKIQIEYVLIGFFSALIIGIISNIILPLLGYSKLVILGPSLSMLSFVVFTTYAIVAKQLFGIIVILTQFLVAIIALILFFQAIVAKTFWMRFLNFSVLGLFSLFGYYLIKATINEIRRREESEKLSRAKSEFISIASHQLRTPMTAISGYLSMLLEGDYGKLSDKMETAIKNVYDSSYRLTKLINDLLNISKVEMGKLGLNLEKTQIENIIDSVVDELKIEAGKKNLYLKWQKPLKQTAEILIDADKIRQVILNVIDNAIKYTGKGGIIIKCKMENGKCKIEIEDTGEGMTKEEQEKLFESFSRGTAGVKLFGAGAGLGLYVAKKFVEMQGGKIWAESEGKSKGSRFYIEFPIATLNKNKYK